MKAKYSPAADGAVALTRAWTIPECEGIIMELL